jgi:cation/acetate symporter
VGAGTPDGLPRREPQTVVTQSDGQVLVNGKPRGLRSGEADLLPVGHLSKLPDGKTSTGPLGPIAFLSTLHDSEFVLWSAGTPVVANGAKTTTYQSKVVSGSQVLRPGNLPAFAGIRSNKIFDKLNFLSLMMALFCGTASLPHILIRYYTVKDQGSARKSTIVGIATIGFFYVLTLYMGLGAMTSGAMDVSDSNMAAPLLARSFSPWLFAIISAIAFTTVLGTVSGLIIASSGAIVHDLLTSVLRIPLSEFEQVRVAKLASVAVGVVAIALGVLFGSMNVTYLVGWAFSIAASANLPALIMLLFWKRTTAAGIAWSVIIGMVGSLAWILMSGDTYKNIYGWKPDQALVPFSQPGIVTIPVSFATLVLVSWFTRKPEER